MGEIEQRNMSKIIDFCKREIVLSIAAVLAVISLFFVTPDSEYIDYIDFRTLGILLCLMAVMEGLKEIGVFEVLAQKMLDKVKNIWQLITILTMLCFFFSMLITNDVALITFVPLTIFVLNMLGEQVKKRLLIPVVVMQTVAANLGSMLTPIGNPQNLYLYSQTEMNIGEFMVLMLPYTALSFVVIMLWSIRVAGGIKGKAISIDIEKTKITKKNECGVYAILFILCLLTVARVLSFEIVVAIVLIAIFVVNKNALKNVDYSLLLTFIAFFIFIGNMGRIEGFKTLLENIIVGNEMITAVAASQIISNVPAALLLSGFTNNYEALIIGTNIGGLGTLIASMASLISFKYVAKEDGHIRGRYIAYFTVANVLILAMALVAAYML